MMQPLTSKALESHKPGSAVLSMSSTPLGKLGHPLSLRLLTCKVGIIMGFLVSKRGIRRTLRPRVGAGTEHSISQIRGQECPLG